MSHCCVAGCKNLFSRNSSLRFYRIPCGFRPFHANRRRLWVEAVQKANGNKKELTGNHRVCGAHFISGVASMDTNSPDFVPSVFPSSCTKPVQTRSQWAKRIMGCKKKLSGRNNAGKKNIKAGPESPVNLQDVPMETENEVSAQTQPPSSVPKEEDGLTEDATKPEKVESQETSSLNLTSCLKPQEVLSRLKYLHPVVVLKPLVLPKDVYQRENHDTACTGVSEPVEDEQQPEEQNSSDLSRAESPEPQQVSRVELSYPCNMCDRTFTAVHHLKRHKILHLKDSRKCLRCGVLFCRRHNHFFFQPTPCIQKTKTDSEDESSSSKEQHLESNLNPEKMEPSQITKIVDNTPPPSASVMDTPPGPDPKPLPNLLRKRPFVNRRGLMSVKPSPVPPPPIPVFTFLRYPVASFHLTSPVLDSPAVVVQPHLPKHPELPPSLKLFSPQYLTSALLHVQRNYEYILNKVPVSSNKIVVKEEENPVVICPVEQPVKKTKKEKIAYDLEIIL
ncbi:uncharacterized protein LOC106519343 [Austrofundulus limnaeus]|uniref:Uncharacterized protein LOC106519343 n=1 Tax=Austrofundulus limnaeus TaxID=52670 RepID=A0A2I4BFA3_AUSLI|nr:PREDICTED: uncharacterized protein LOC106519343 [Austrofundulus limnaeus]